MMIAIGNDHRGYAHKVALVRRLERGGHGVLDMGCGDCASADYPDHALAVGEAVAAGDAELGVLICGSGIGMSIAANKVPGIRAALCCNDEMAATTRRHNDSNVICFSGDHTSIADAERMLELWLATEFEGGRHARRVDKIRAFERRDGDRKADA
ncbi:ribose 5-phosphate isomerase B [bacterium]|nr:ribose 5-phosphate isomerase B [bacterium]MBU1073108.1 ribose 5-phosphate isomerase B [bacterium]MBU1674651.1 ribose 5-phosphate isomerase B [bacterium]